MAKTQEIIIPSAELVQKFATELNNPAMQRAVYDALLENDSKLLNDPEVIAMRRNHPDYIKAKAQLRKDARQKN
jgi:hypothetical protein